MTRSDRTPEVPVVIARAGPAGLVAALTLARNGIGSLLVERNPSLNGRLGHAWLARANGHRRSTLDLLGQGLTLLAGPATRARAELAAAISGWVEGGLVSSGAGTGRWRRGRRP
jgi:2-polyprenyl-6-methoxyphenol hydroxylase-like FAD-dependent oxidoreductase